MSHILDEAGASPPDATYVYATCDGDADRPRCQNTVTQTRQPDGTFRPRYCMECDAAWESRRRRMTERWQR